MRIRPHHGFGKRGFLRPIEKRHRKLAIVAVEKVRQRLRPARAQQPLEFGRHVRIGFDGKMAIADGIEIGEQRPHGIGDGRNAVLLANQNESRVGGTCFQERRARSASERGLAETVLAHQLFQLEREVAAFLDDGKAVTIRATLQSTVLPPRGNVAAARLIEEDKHP